MTSIDAVNKIKIMLGLAEEASSEAVAEKFEKTATLTDGTEVYVEGEFEPGAQLSVITEDGLIPAPEGSHTLENGTEVTVDAAGIITEVAEAAAEEMEEEEKEEMAEHEDKKEMEEDKVEMTEEVVKAVVEAIAPIVAELEKVKEEMEKMKGDFSAFSADSAANPLRNNSNDSKSIDSRIEALKKFRKN